MQSLGASLCERPSFGLEMHYSILDNCLFSLQFPLELDAWKILETHVLSDYMNHEVINSLVYFSLSIFLDDSV